MSLNSHKEKCKELRKLRIEIAEQLGVGDFIKKEECTYQGECTGTCLMCEYEEELIMNKLYELKAQDNLDILTHKETIPMKPPIFSFEPPKKPIKTDRLPGKIDMPKPPIFPSVEKPHLDGQLIPNLPPIDEYRTEGLVVQPSPQPPQPKTNVFNEFLGKKKTGDK